MTTTPPYPGMTIRVPIGTKVTFVESTEDGTETAVVAVRAYRRISTHPKREGMVILATRSAETIGQQAQEWVHPEDGEVV